MRRYALILLITASALTVCRADDPPLEGAPMMTGTNVPAYGHTNGPSGPRAILRPNRQAPNALEAIPMSATNSTPDSDRLVAQNKAAMGPQVLQSVEAAAAPKAPPKGPGMVIYGAYGFKVGNEALWVIPEKYLSDLTNHYPFQYAHKIVLPEP